MPTAFLFVITSSAGAQTQDYKLEDAPWSNQAFNVCPVPDERGLRAVVFEPVVEEWSYEVPGDVTSNLVVTKDGIQEVISENHTKHPAYYLKSQTIGYLNEKDIWVDKTGKFANTSGDLKTISGHKTPPKMIPAYEKFVYEANFKAEYDAAMEKIHYAPPCTVFSVGHMNKLEAKLQYDFGKNNPYHCGASGQLEQSQKLNYTKVSHRPIVCCPDGSNYFVKFSDSEIKTYRAYADISKILYPADGSQVCEWNDLGSLIGYELIRDSE